MNWWPFPRISRRDREALAAVLDQSFVVRKLAESIRPIPPKPQPPTSKGISLIYMGSASDPVSTFAAQESANLTAIQNALTNTIAPGISALDALIQQLEASAAGPGGTTLSAADQALLDNIVTQSSALVVSFNAISVAPPVAPAPPTPPATS